MTAVMTGSWTMEVGGQYAFSLFMRNSSAVMWLTTAAVSQSMRPVASSPATICAPMILWVDLSARTLTVMGVPPG